MTQDINSEQHSGEYDAENNFFNSVKTKLKTDMDQNHIYNVSVVLFPDLHISNITKAKPESPYSHSDNVQRLSWLAAKSIPESVKADTGNKNVDLIIEKGREYQKVDF